MEWFLLLRWEYAEVVKLAYTTDFDKVFKTFIFTSYFAYRSFYWRRYAINKPRWKQFPEDYTREVVMSSHSTREVAQKLGYAVCSGGSHTSLNRMYDQLNIDTSHFYGKSWNKGNQAYDLSDCKFQCYKVKNETLKSYLIKERGLRCENCGNVEWMGYPINLEVHHIDGVSNNNQVDNLLLLCPNCHSYTNNFRGRNLKQTVISDGEFVSALIDSANIRQALGKLGLTQKGANYQRAYDLIYKHNLTHLKNNLNKNTKPS